MVNARLSLLSLLIIFTGNAYSQGRRPVGLWVLDSTYGGKDLSGNGNHATFSNVAYDTGPQGQVQGAVKFAGTENSYVEIPNNGKLDVKYSVSYAAWFYPTGGVTQAPLFSMVSGSAPYGFIVWQYPTADCFSTALYYPNGGGGSHYYEETGSFSDDNWFFVASTYSYESGILRMYVNSVKTFEKFVGRVASGTDGTARMGALGTDARRLNGGRLHCTHLYDRELSFAELESIKYNCIPQELPYPVGWWPFNDRHGSNDVSGNNNHGVLGPKVSLADGYMGEAAGSYKLIGELDSNIHIPNNGALDVRYSITWLAHVYVGASNSGPLFNFEFPAGNDQRHEYGFIIWQHPSQLKFYAGFWSRSNGASVLSRNVEKLVVNAWNYLAVTYDYDTGILKMYHEGTNVLEETVGTYELGTQYHARIGARDETASDARYFKGQITCVRMFDMALPEVDIQKLRHRCEPSVDPPDPLGFWKLNGFYKGADLGPFANDALLSGVTYCRGPRGRMDGALCFNASSSSHVEIPSRYYLDMEFSFTFAAFVYVKNTTDYMSGPVLSYAGLQIVVDSNASVDVKMRDRSQNVVVNTTHGNAFPLNKWNYLAVTYDYSLGEYKIWVDAKETAYNHIGVHGLDTTGTVRVGARQNDTRLFRGRLSCLQLYNVALSQSQILNARALCAKSVPFNRALISPLANSSFSGDEWSDTHGPERSRLHTRAFHAGGTYTGAWSAKAGCTSYCWIQVDLGKVYYILAIATQGRNSKYHNQYVMSYRLQYGDTESSLSLYSYGESPYTFTGNYDQDTVIKHQLKRPFYARYVRVFPMTWFGHQSMRWELYTTATKFVQGSSLPRPVALWPMSARYVTSDVTGRGTSFSVHGDTSLTSGLKNDKNTAFEFFGQTTDYVEIPNVGGNIDVRYSFTWMSYLYPRSSGSDGPIFNYMKLNGVSTYGLHIWALGPSQKKLFIRFNIGDGDGDHGLGVSSVVLTSDRWQHVSITYDYHTGMTKFWIDGERVYSHYVGQLELETRYGVRIGRRDDMTDTRYFKGKISCVQLYDIALNAHQIKQAMKNCVYREGPMSSFSKMKAVIGNKVLASRNIHTVTTTQNELECLAQCVQNVSCHGINYAPVSQTCELGDKPHHQLTEDDFEDRGSEYEHFSVVPDMDQNTKY